MSSYYWEEKKQGRIEERKGRGKKKERKNKKQRKEKKGAGSATTRWDTTVRETTTGRPQSPTRIWALAVCRYVGM